MLSREREAELAKLEYLAMVQALLVGIDSKQFEQKTAVLQELKTSLSEVLHQDVYINGYRRNKRQRAAAEKKREKEMLSRLATMGKQGKG